MSFNPKVPLDKLIIPEKNSTRVESLRMNFFIVPFQYRSSKEWKVSLTKRVACSSSLGQRVEGEFLGFLYIFPSSSISLDSSSSQSSSSSSVVGVVGLVSADLLHLILPLPEKIHSFVYYNWIRTLKNHIISTNLVRILLFQSTSE